MTAIPKPPPAADAPSGDDKPDAAPFHASRRNRQSEVAEDYCELIADLQASAGEARAVDIARRLGVTHPTVVKTIARLQRDGLVVSKPYRAVFLTETGRAMADKARRRHAIVMEFLLALGVGEATARADAEGIEHHVSEETLAAFERLIAERRDPVSG
ncbi:MAG TPA: manganese-binding transcriptional regulator MntR [Alphaproteobacteria bacterium]|nr:manganese-binding transcriptional regulator MntR [Alphaproteobacteria bacterium]